MIKSRLIILKNNWDNNRSSTYNNLISYYIDVAGINNGLLKDDVLNIVNEFSHINRWSETTYKLVIKRDEKYYLNPLIINYLNL